MHQLKRASSITAKEVGKLISINDVQLSKTDFPNDCREVEEEKIACFNEMQWEKAWSSIETTEEGITILSNMQPQNALWPIVVTDSGIMTSLSSLYHWNKSSGILVTWKHNESLYFHISIYL